jgi:ABC-2 type transport system permease protein
MGDRVQTELFNWYYHPLVAPGSNHPIVNNIDRVNLYFPASVDTIQTHVPIRKTFLLKSSEYARTQLTPVRLNFEILRFEPEPDQFDQGPLPMAVLLEGQFSSMFENRMTEEMHNLLSSIDMEYTLSDTAGKVLLAADGDLIKNLYKPDTDEFSELGYNKYEQYTFKGNQDFVLNAVEYMIEDGGILTARSKDVKLRMLDTVKAREESLKWQLLNICLPLVCLILGGILFQYFRKRRYSTV